MSRRRKLGRRSQQRVFFIGCLPGDDNLQQGVQHLPQARAGSDPRRHQVMAIHGQLAHPAAGIFCCQLLCIGPQGSKGPGLRQVLNALLEAVITGQTPNEKDALLAAAAQFSAS